MPHRVAARVTGESLPRNTSSSRPRTWRSVPAYSARGAPRWCLPGSHATAMRTRSTDTDRTVAPALCKPSRPAPSAPPKTAARQHHWATALSTSSRSRGETTPPRRPCRAPPWRPRDARSCRRRAPAAGMRSRRRPARCRRRCPAASTAFRRPTAPHRRTARRSPSRTHVAAWPAADNRACPRPASTSAALAAAVADGVGQRATQSSQIGSTRATGVCCSMNSLTRICHGVTPGRRHGRSRCACSYHRDN